MHLTKDVRSPSEWGFGHALVMEPARVLTCAVLPYVEQI